ncbi:methyltransferase domain-containing protein [Crocosphaera sp.]|uniref:methyltransferase domain-containing protein n=1 Tax=Crocosphaera sp. TaxID=2729996 RepID=UPI0026097346|nr:methyltransferase domain-containing protein [Crocosphaera sp.]MDJ0580405.1 methyltransferase domain-containing protein [Crocosphaera sp.]
MLEPKFQERILNDSDICTFFKDFELNKEEKVYLEYHSTRIAYFVNLTAKFAKVLSSQTNTKLKVLDIGPHFLTSSLRQYFGDSIILNTLGWTNPLAPSSIIDNHFEFDLNNTQDPQKWLVPEPHDIIVMGEVIEHLYTSPELVLSFIKTFLVPGGFLIIGTPNAVSIDKRLSMFNGKNPYEKIRKDNTNPGHFREYTADELEKIGQQIGLKAESIEYKDFSQANRKIHLLKNINPAFKDYLSAVFLFPN